MAPMYILARDIKTRNTTVALRLRLGSYVHFHIPWNNVSVSNEFIEGHVYCIKNFLSFTSIKTLERIDQKVLIDVIGRVVQIFSPLDKLINARPFKLIDFVIEDLNLGDQSSSNMVISTIFDLFDRSEVATKIPKEIESLVGRGLLFKINVKRDQLEKHNLAFPVRQIKEDIVVLNQYCPGLLKDKKHKGTDFVDPMEDDLDSDEVINEEAESPVPNALTQMGTVGGNESETVKRRLLDEFSSTQCSKKKDTYY
nr:replication protein A 70 kDa DNA-binding subunit B-like [Ipomoea batatas]